MSPDTPDPERPADRPGAPGAERAEGAGPADAGADPGGTARPDEERVVPGWPAGLPVPAGTPTTVPGTDPPAGHPGAVDAAPDAAAGPDRSGGRLRVAGATLVGAVLLAVLGAPLGLLWAAVAPGTPVQKTAEGAVYATPQPEQPIAADGWFSLLGLGFGVLAAAALWLLARRRRGPAGLVAGVLGGLGAALVAWQVGRRAGLGAYHRLLATAPDGALFTKPADLRAGGVDWYFGLLPVPYGNLLLPAFGAAVTYTLLAGWSRWPSLRPEPELEWPPGDPGPADPGFSSGSAGPPVR